MTRAIKILCTAATTMLLLACGGGSTSGGGTADSPFVGTYKGAGTVRVSTDAGSGAVSENVIVLVHRDGLVQVGEAESTIYASGPLNRDGISISENASVLIDPACTGTLTLSGSFSIAGDDSVFQGRWSSSDVACFDTPGSVSGSVTVQRTGSNARGSRVFETGNPAMLDAYRQATR